MAQPCSPAAAQLAGKGVGAGGGGVEAGECAQQALLVDPPGWQEIERAGEGLGAACEPSLGGRGLQQLQNRAPHCRGRAGRGGEELLKHDRMKL